MDRDDARAALAALFQKHNSGDRDAWSALVPLVVAELRRIAGEDARDHPARAVSLAGLYLQVAGQAAIPIQSHALFSAVCASAMRRAVVDYMAEDGAPDRLSGTEFILDLEAALRIVEGMNPRLARVVECRYFADLTEEATARALEIDPALVQREWLRARAWTLREIAARSEAGGSDAPLPNAAWVDAVFDDALALPPGELDVFLGRCADAPGDLRGRVEELLRFSSAVVPRFEPGDLSTEFLWSVLRASAADAPAGPAAVEPLMLESAPDAAPGVRRFVPGAIGQDLAAFRRRPDWRVLSSLTHPGIAKLTEAGTTDDGQLFVVSELVDGRPIDRYCDEEKLSIDARLELFLKVCQAVQYAHRKLAVHGAIEPSNVVVTADGEVKLLEFGFSGLLAPAAPGEDEGALSSALRLPEYASPEQLKGEPLAVASDVYQLGLLLYVLLTGEQAQVPAESTDAAEAQAVCDRVPARPSVAAASAPNASASLRRTRRGALARRLRGDLDAIVMYALRKDPDRRYPSVSLLLSDIQRYAMRQPVWAQGDGLAYRFRKFAVRRWVPIAATIVLMSVGAAAMPGPFPGRAHWSSPAVTADDVEQLIGEIFAPPAVRSGDQAPNALHVEQAARMARAELAAQPERQSRLFTDLGRAYAALGYYDRAITILEQALALRRAHSGDDSVEVADTLEALGRSRHQLGRYDEAETDLRTVIAIRQIRLGAAHPDTVAATIALGDLLHSRGQLLDAERLLRRVVDALRPQVVKAAGDAPVNQLLPRALRGLANIVRDRGALGEATVLYGDVIALLEHTPAASPQVARTQVDLARALIARIDLDRAEAELADALPALRRVHAGDHPLVGIALRELGSLRLEQGKFEQADELLSEALSVQEQWLGRLHPLVPRTRGLLAELARRRGRPTEGAALAAATLKEFERLGVPDHPWTIDVRATLADALITLGQDDEALRVLSPALTSAPRMFVSYDARLIRLQDALVRASRNLPDVSSRRSLTGSVP